MSRTTNAPSRSATEECGARTCARADERVRCVRRARGGASCSGPHRGALSDAAPGPSKGRRWGRAGGASRYVVVRVHAAGRGVHGAGRAVRGDGRRKLAQQHGLGDGGVRQRCRLLRVLWRQLQRCWPPHTPVRAAAGAPCGASDVLMRVTHKCTPHRFSSRRRHAQELYGQPAPGHAAVAERADVPAALVRRHACATARRGGRTAC